MQIKWQSQLGQDEFVAHMTRNKRNGTYVDIGAGDPVQISNTNALHHSFGWSGIVCEKDADLLCKHLQTRSQIYAHDDATTADWNYLFSRIAVNGWIDYLSLDLEPPDLTYSVLQSLPLDKFKFRIATVEHDRYRPGGHRRAAEMATMMYRAGYIYFATAEVKQDKGPPIQIEDWWIHGESGLEIPR